MKILAALFALMVGVSIAAAQNPSYRSFDSNQFSYTSGHIWIKSGAKMTNPVFQTSITLNGSTITSWPTGGTNFDILDVGTIFVTNGITLGGTTATNWVWVNDNGTITPAPGQTTNSLLFTSGLADNATNVAMVVDTANVWNDDRDILWVANGGHRKAWFTGNGALFMGDTPSTTTAGVDLEANSNASYLKLNPVEATAPTTIAFLKSQHDQSSATLTAMDTATNLWSMSLYQYASGGGMIQTFAMWEGTTNYYVVVDPSTDLAVEPFRFNTAITIASSNLLTVGNNGTNKFTVDYAGNVSAAGTATALGHDTTPVAITQDNTNVVVNMAVGVGRTLLLTATNDLYIITSNRVAGAQVLLDITAGTTNRNITFADLSFWMSARPTVVSSNHVMWVSITSTTTTTNGLRKSAVQSFP